MKTIRVLRFLPVLFSILIFQIGFSQNFVESAESGFIIKKLVSNTTVASGVTFSYTIFFSLPAGASNITITDNVPAGLAIAGVVASPVCGTPTISVVGNTVTYQLTGVSTACSGTFQINVYFPAGVTCDGERADNSVCIAADGIEPFCTEKLQVTAQADNPFRVSKSVIAGVNPDAYSSGCYNIAAVGDTLCYNIWVSKGSGFAGDTTGQMNMASAVVTDVLPAGASLVSSTCGATQSGSTITWNIGTLNAANPYASAYCQFKVFYPAGTFPAGTMVNNQAVLNGTACGAPVDTFSNTTCVLIAEPQDSATFSKSLYLTNNVPGCTGFYRLNICNKGNTNLNFNISDIFPSNITVDQISVSTSSSNGSYNASANTGAITISSGVSGGSSYTVPTSTTINSYDFSQVNLLPGNCTYITFFFTTATVPPGTVITNCATFNSTPIGTLNSCVDFTVGDREPDLCLVKDICDDDNSYQVGDVVRYRIRVQNIGSQTLTGATLNDLLDPNLSYVGNELYYIGNTWNTPCGPDSVTIPTGATAWTGVTTSHSGNNLSWNLPDIDSDCQAFYYTNCGIYGTSGIPFYFIEFDAVVNSDAAAGLVGNSFTATGGNLTATETSNTANIIINAIYGMELLKEISTDNGVTFADTAISAAGSTVMYRLGFKNTSNLPVNQIKLIDLLPRDDSPNDWQVLNRTVPRGSQFDVTYSGGLAISSTQGPVSPVPSASFTAGNNICLPILGYSPSGCVAPAAWPWPAAPVTRNLGLDFTTFSLNQGETLYADFNVQLAANAQLMQKVCNDFAANAVGNFILDGTTTMVPLTSNASAPVCLTVGENPNETCCDQVKIEPNPNDRCCLNLSSECRIESLTVHVTNGVFSSVMWNATDPPGTAFIGQNSYTFTLTTPTALQMKNCFVSSDGGPITVTYDILFPGGETCKKEFTLDGCKDCCPEFISKSNSEECRFELVQEQSECDAEIKQIEVNLSNGTFANTINTSCPGLVYTPTSYIGTSSVSISNFSCPVSGLNFLTAEVDAINCQEFVYLEMLITLSDGRVCAVRDSMLCPCPPPSDDCCPIVEDEYATCEPSNNLIHGTYTLQNLNSSGICYVEISAAPAGTFLQGTLTIDGSVSSVGWTTSRIPATGNLSPPAGTDIEFTLYGIYSGTITLNIYHCDGTSCSFELPWNQDPTDDPVVVVGTGVPFDTLKAAAFVLKAEGPSQRAVKYISVGMPEADNEAAEFFAISGAVHPADTLPYYLEPVNQAKMGKHNAFFELATPQRLMSGASSGQFNMVFANRLPKLRYTLFDDSGNVMGQAEVDGLIEGGVVTSLVELQSDKEEDIRNILLAPNPADQMTTLRFQLLRPQDLRIELYDVDGRFIQLVQDRRFRSGEHEITLLTNQLASGPYLLKFISENGAETLQLVIVR